MLTMSSGWDGTAEAYDASFARLCFGTVDALIQALGPALAGERLLDVGSGPGAVAAAAEDAGFAVTGVDADDSMIKLARRKHPDIAFVQGALPQLPFSSGVFDAVGANFVVNHCADPRAALRELRRVTRLGGRVALTIWLGLVSPLNQLWNDVMADASVRPPPGKTLPPEKDFERTGSGLAGVVTGSGLQDVVVREVQWLFCISPNDLWRAVAGGIATIGQTYRAQDKITQLKMHDAYTRLTCERYPDGELRLHSTALAANAVRGTAD